MTPESRVTLRGVIGVPLEWRGRIIGACIVFSRDDLRTFGPADAELLRLFAKHAAIALANARMHEEAEERARSEAVAAERDRMLAELHDTLAQRLVSVRAHIDSAGENLTEVKGAVQAAAGGTADVQLGAMAEQLRRASATAGDALIEARLTLLGLASSPLDGRTLEAALRSEVAWARSTGHLEVGFVSAGTPVALDGELSREVLRTAREALTNIVAHARARTVRLGLLYEPERSRCSFKTTGRVSTRGQGGKAVVSGCAPCLTGRARSARPWMWTRCPAGARGSAPGSPTSATPSPRAHDCGCLSQPASQRCGPASRGC